MLLQGDEDALALGWYQAFNNFLGNIFRRVVQKLLELQVAKLVDHVFLSVDLSWIHAFKLVDLAFLLKLVLE